MLTELMRAELKEKMFTPQEIEEMDSYDSRTGKVTFKDGTERTAVSCFTRVMGYFRNVDAFNIGKKGEYKERLWFTEDNINKQLKAA